MTLSEISSQIVEAKQNIFLIYAFNGTGKTRLSVNLKDSLKQEDDSHQGVYFNAYSEDLFIWDNEAIELNIQPSSLNDFHQYIAAEEKVYNKLQYYSITYDFKFNYIQDDNPELGWRSVSFFNPEDSDTNIKISRGEERIFVWCWFLTLFEVESLIEDQEEYIFIDDPVSSLDDNNIFNTARLLLDLFKEKIDTTKVIVTTHHAGLFSTLESWLRKGDNSAVFKKRKENGDMENKYITRILEKTEEGYKLKSTKKGSFFYHLTLVDLLKEAIVNKEFHFQHFIFLRQLLETVSSFQGKPRFSYVLEKMNFPDWSSKTDIINARCHEYYNPKASFLAQPDKDLIIEIMDSLDTKFNFA